MKWIYAMKKRNDSAQIPLNSSFDPAQELKKLRARKGPKPLRKSTLLPYLGHLMQLKQAGATFLELQQWLQETHQIKMAPSTIYRFLKSAAERVSKAAINFEEKI